MAYIDVYNLRYRSENLRSRVVVGVVRAGVDVLNEDVGTPNHAARVIWARSALGDANGMGEKMFWGVLGNATIQAQGEGCADGDIQFVVNSLVNTFAVGEQ